MAFTKFEKDVANISKLSNRPNQNDGLSAAQLKGRFDKAPVDIQDFINDHIDELESTADNNSGADKIGVTPLTEGGSDRLQTALEEIQSNAEGLDSSAVHKAGNETISGIKTFATSPIIPTPSANNHAATKRYVDDKDATAVHNTGDETINGAKTFATPPVIPEPTASNHAATRQYADAIANARYTKTDMQTSGHALVHWENLINVPSFGDEHWKTPVANRAALPLTGNTLGDNRIVLDDGDGKQAAYSCIATTGNVDAQWGKIGDIDWQSEEATRQAQENFRQSQEDNRNDNEIARQTAELDRENAESDRVVAETNRNGAELNRASAEGLRDTAEGLRVSAEAARVNAEGNSTKGRVKAENDRVAAEGLRASAETARISAEASRASEENLRVIAESARASAETLRVSAEDDRQSAEIIREQNEELRNSPNSENITLIVDYNGEDGFKSIQDAVNSIPFKSKDNYTIMVFADEPSTVNNPIAIEKGADVKIYLAGMTDNDENQLTNRGFYVDGIKKFKLTGFDIDCYEACSINAEEIEITNCAFILSANHSVWENALEILNCNYADISRCSFEGNANQNNAPIFCSNSYVELGFCTFKNFNIELLRLSMGSTVLAWANTYINIGLPENQYVIKDGTSIFNSDILSTADIADDLETNDSEKVLSAKQGKLLKDAHDALDQIVDSIGNAIVRYDIEQSLTMKQRHQARLNIGAAPVIGIKDAYELQAAIRSGYAESLLSVGDFFTVGRDSTDWLFQVAAFDYDVPVKSQFAHSMRLLMHPVFANVTFDAIEAIYFAETALPAGPYWLKDSRTSKYFSFTLAQTVPAGGQIVYSSYGASPDYIPPSVRTYASQVSTTIIETAIITVADDEPTVGTELTTLNDGNRGRFGSNNWLDSAIRQWLNSDKASGWWVPSNIYDRPQSSPSSGFLYGIDEDLLGCIGQVRLRTGLNPYDNEGTFGYSDNKEMIFLPSRTEMGLGNSSTNIYETPVTAEGVAKTDTLPLFKSNEDRIKYLNGVARYWWLRSPLPGLTHASHTYDVVSSGALNYNYAMGAHGAVPACTIY